MWLFTLFAVEIPRGELVPFPQSKGCLQPFGKRWVTAFLDLSFPATRHSSRLHYLPAPGLLFPHWQSLQRLAWCFWGRTEKNERRWPACYNPLPGGCNSPRAQRCWGIHCCAFSGVGKGNSLQHGMREWFLGSNLCQAWLTETLDSKGYELVGAFKQITMSSSQGENVVLKYCCLKYFKPSLHILVFSNCLVNTAIKKMNIFDLTRLLKKILKLFKFLPCCCFQLVYI